MCNTFNNNKKNNDLKNMPLTYTEYLNKIMIIFLIGTIILAKLQKIYHFLKYQHQCQNALWEEGNVMLWATFSWETLGPGIHADVTLTHTTY